jgi:phage tail protein X
VGEALALERLEEDVEALLVAVPGLADRHARLRRHPAVTADDAELAAPAGEDVELRDLGGEDGGVATAP